MTEFSAENKTELEKRYRITAFLVSAQIAALFILTATAFLTIKPEIAPRISENTRMTLWVAALFIALGTFVMRRLFYRWDRLRYITLLKGIKGLLKTLSINSIFLAAMAEFVAIIGFVIAFLTSEPFEMLRSAIIALVVFLINFPRRKVWEKITENLQTV